MQAKQEQQKDGSSGSTTIEQRQTQLSEKNFVQ
jgi:hypothetical protein